MTGRVRVGRRMLQPLSQIIIALALGAGTPTMGQVGGATTQIHKVALVIGIRDYKYIRKLQTTVNDARLISDSLLKDGFTLVDGRVQEDLDYATFNTVIAKFVAVAHQADVAVIYYAGHGAQVDGVNYLLPTSFKLPDAPAKLTLDQLRGQSIDATRFLHAFDDANVRLKLLILDACRDNPIPAGRSLSTGPSSGLASMSRSLFAMSVPSGTAIWYSTQLGNIAQEFTSVHPNNGPFAPAIAAHITQRGATLSSVFNAAGTDVLEETTGYNPPQQPWLEATPMSVDFVFVDAQSGRSAFVSYENSVAGSPPARGGSRLEQLFGVGLSRPGKSFVFGEDYTDVNRSLDSSFQIVSYDSLPKAAEYKGDDVRYFWRPLIGLPSVLAAIQPQSGFNGAQCVDPQSYVAFFFKQRKLFHISLRFTEASPCAPYDWFFGSQLVGGANQKRTLRRGDGVTSLVSHVDHGLFIFEITNVGVAAEKASIF